MEKIWLKSYPQGVGAEIDSNKYQSILEIFEHSCRKYKDKIAFENMGATLTYEELNQLTFEFAAFLQNVAKVNKGDRVAIMLPNILQYPVAMYGVLRAGGVVVNTNPLYTARELKHQLKDSGAKAIIIFENSAAHLQEILPETNVETIVVTGIGDLLGFPKSLIVNSVIRYVKKMVPAYSFKKSYGFYEALDLGAKSIFRPVDLQPDDIAFLQYTGGTTGVSKGAVLTHRNIVSNMLQIFAWLKDTLEDGKEHAILALPLYHIFSLIVNGLMLLYYGAKSEMITNPKDIDGFVKLWKKKRFTVFPGLNTLFNALMNHPEFKNLDFTPLKVSVAGGMALQTAVAQRWKDTTKSLIVEGYGLTETSPVACVNPLDGSDKMGTIGLPVPSTELSFRNDEGKEVAVGEIGEICIKGPQVMWGYWNQPEETKKVMTEDGFFKSGDIGIIDEQGFTKIVDRKKDMILVSGFNVYPNEIEDVVASNPKVLEVAAVGVPDAKSTEAVKVFVVKKDPSLTAEEVIDFCRQNLTNYKVPRHVEFRDALPKSNVGKVLRRELKNQ